MRTEFRVTDDMRSSSRLKAALAYAKAGIAVLPLHGIKDGACTCGDAACAHAGKHPIANLVPNGFKSATTNQATIKTWWSRRPEANVGVVPTDGLVVVDYDGAEGKSWIRDQDLPETTEVITGRGGHLYFVGKFSGEAPEGRSVTVRHDGNGYVVAPPSRHVTGVRYCWGDEVDRAAKIPAFPTNVRLSKRVTLNMRDSTHHIAEGSRNETLASLAGQILNAGIRDERLQAALEGLNRRLCKPPLKDSEVQSIARSIGRYAPKPSQCFDEMESVVTQKIKWLYEPYFPIGVVTILEGDPGGGKSNFTMALAAALSNGSPVPFSNSKPTGASLLMSAEDDPARIMKPRLLANGADTSMIRYQKAHVTLDARGVQLVREELAANRAKLVVIDPIIAYLPPEEDLHRTDDMMRFLTELSQVAEGAKAAIIVVRHLRKAQDGSAISAGQGSMALAGRARSIVRLGRHPSDEDQRAVAHVKSNYAKEGATITFRLNAHKGIPSVEWTGVDPDISAEDLVPVARPRGRPNDELQEAAGYLLVALSKAEREWEDVVRDGASHGHKEATLRRAREFLKLAQRRDGKRVLWSLPERAPAV